MSHQIWCRRRGRGRPCGWAGVAWRERQREISGRQRRFLLLLRQPSPHPPDDLRDARFLSAQSAGSTPQGPGKGEMCGPASFGITLPVAGEQFAQLHRCADNRDGHHHDSRAVEHAGEHGHTLFGKHRRRLARAAATRLRCSRLEHQNPEARSSINRRTSHRGSALRAWRRSPRPASHSESPGPPPAIRAATWDWPPAPGGGSSPVSLPTTSQGG